MTRRDVDSPHVSRLPAPTVPALTLQALAVPTLIVLACLCAGSAWAKTSDRNQTLNTGSDRTDCSIGEGPCLLIGNVHITQGTLEIQAAKADVRRSGGDIQSVKLTGAPVKLKQQTDDGNWINADAAQIDYDLPQDTVVFTGNAHVQQPGRGSISGERIVYNMRTGQVQSGAAAGGGRVNMTFEPKNKTPAAPAKTTTPKKSAPAEPAKRDGT